MKKFLLLFMSLVIGGMSFHTVVFAAENCSSHGRNNYECTSHGCVVGPNGYCEDTPASTSSEQKECDGYKLNTNIPFVGNCISFGKSASNDPNTTTVTQVDAFPRLMGALMNIVMTASLIVGFLMILVAGIMITMGGFGSLSTHKKGIDMIKKVGMVLALIGLSGVILKLINPTFFV